MKITALSLHGSHGWPELGTDALAPTLNVFYGASASGKTTLADLITHTLYGRRFNAERPNEPALTPAGELFVTQRGRHYRLRRSHTVSAEQRLTIAALDQSPADEDTVRQLVAYLGPMLLRPLFAVSFQESPQLEWLLSPEFSREFRDALWRLKWAPPAVEAELRPIYARLRALETQVARLVHRLDTTEGRAKSDAKAGRRARKRRASHYLARLTDGELTRLWLGDANEARVTTRAGESIPVESLWSTQRDQVYLSLCLSLVAAFGRQGARLPLVLDEPFARMDAKSAAALVDLLSEFCTSERQVLVFTDRQEAAQRSAARGATVFEMHALRETQLPEEAAVAESRPQPRVRRRERPAPLRQREAG